METPTRRDFMRAVAGTVAFGVVSENSYSQGNSEADTLKRDWDEAIKENNLREEVSVLMKQSNMIVTYEGRLTYKNIIRADISVRRLQEIKTKLEPYKDGHGRGFLHLSDFL